VTSVAGGLKDNLDDLDDDDEVSELNVTPFIDVMLVLLIIFMVAAPLSTVDVHVNLPVATASPQPRPEKPLFVTLKADLTLSIGESVVARSQLIEQLDGVTSGKREARLLVRADKAAPYGEVLQLLDQLRSAGYLKVGLVALEGVSRQHTEAPSEGR
jgi:biopolymer transport protein ExbD